MLKAFPQIFLTVGTVWGIIAFVSLILAWRAIINGRVGTHKSIMTVLVLLGWVFTFFYLSGRFMGADRVSVPVRLIPWFATHGTVAGISLLYVSIILWARLTEKGESDPLGFRRYLNSHHRRYATIGAVLWIFTNLGGIFNAYLLDFGR